MIDQPDSHTLIVDGRTLTVEDTDAEIVAVLSRMPGAVIFTADETGHPLGDLVDQLRHAKVTIPGRSPSRSEELVREAMAQAREESHRRFVEDRNRHKAFVRLDVLGCLFIMVVGVAVCLFRGVIADFLIHVFGPEVPGSPDYLLRIVGSGLPGGLMIFFSAVTLLIIHMTRWDPHAVDAM